MRHAPSSTTKWLAALLGLSALSLTGSASAGSDEAAMKLRDDAIFNDYLATSYDKSQQKLEKAIGMCAGTACAAKTRARLQCDLATVLFAAGKKKDAEAHFAAAVDEDPEITIDKDLTSPEVRAALDAAKSAKKSKGTEPTSSTPTPAAPGDSDMTHTPPKEQPFLTPLPLYVELPEGVSVAKVYVRYRPFGSTEWKTAHMKKVGKGWGVELPCADVGTMAGDLAYFVQAVDASGDVVAMSGRLNAPYRVAIKETLSGKPAHLPGEPPPVACPDPHDCPPGFPGCNAVKGTGGAACETDAECDKGYVCTAHMCEAGPDVPKTGKGKQSLLSVAFQQELLFVSSAEDVCNGGNRYACFRHGGGEGSYYQEIPLKNADNQVNGGVGVATRRVLLGFDFAVLTNVTLGARVGFAFGGGPARDGARSFFPLHLEARAAYWLGSAPLSKSGPRFYGAVSFGLAEVDSKVPVTVYQDRAAFDRGEAMDMDAWRKTGTGFVGLSLGSMLAFGDSHGVLIEAKLMQMLVTPGTAIGLSLGYAIGI